MPMSELETISIIIPIHSGKDFLNDLLDSLEAQTLKPDEIIFIISETPESSNIIEILRSRKSLNIKYKLIEPAYPGKARNIGVEISCSKLLAFLDLRTIPRPDWLEKTYYEYANSDCVFLGGIQDCRANTIYKKILRAATRGDLNSRSLAGSIVSASHFNKETKFRPDMRAGEDWEWINRFTKKHPFKWSNFIGITYHGLPNDIFTTIKKWHVYSIENAKANIFVFQKFLYFLLFIILLGSLYMWNYIFTGGQWSASPYFIPHLNKISWALLLTIYFVYRGVFRPLQLGVNKNYVLPSRWLLIGLVGILIDLVKAPGRVLGFIYFIKQKLK